MSDSITTKKRLWWAVPYVLLQWPFIIIGALAGFAWEGIDLGLHLSRHIQRKAEKNAREQ